MHEVIRNLCRRDSTRQIAKEIKIAFSEGNHGKTSQTSHLHLVKVNERVRQKLLC